LKKRQDYEIDTTDRGQTWDSESLQCRQIDKFERPCEFLEAACSKRRKRVQLINAKIAIYLLNGLRDCEGSYGTI
jgi:hypothetical protein